MFMSRNQSVERPFGTYNLARHRDIARLWCQTRSQPFGKFIGAQKNDGDCYFRRWYMAVMNFGDIASEFSGHTVLDRSLVFGFGPSPEITHFGGTEPMEKAMNAAWIVMDHPVERYFDALTPEEAVEQEQEQMDQAAGSNYMPELVDDSISECSASTESFGTCSSITEAQLAMAEVDAILQDIQEAERAANEALAGSYREDARREQLPTDGALLMDGLRMVVASGWLEAAEVAKLSTALPIWQVAAQLAQFQEWHYPEAQPHLHRVDPLYGIPVEEVTSETVINMGKRVVMNDQEVLESGNAHKVIPTGGIMYVDDQVLIAVLCLGIHLTMRSHAAAGIVARLGPTGLSMKAVQKEMVFKVSQNTIGQQLDCLKGEFRPTETRISKFVRYLEEYLVRVVARDINAGEAYAPYSLGLWVSIGVWWLKAFIHGLKTPLNGFDTNVGDKLSKVIPNRRGLVVSDAWMELEDHVRTLLVLESLRAKLPWRTSMVQMLEISERLLEKTANFGRVETDACIWGAGGVNMKVREFFRIVHPEWVRDQIKHAMAAGLDETTARCFTIALVELVAVFLSQVFWGGRTNEMGMIWDIWNVVDNTNTQAWMEKLWAGPLLASKYLRGMAVLGMRRKYNCATTGERTKFMHFADPLSRVWEKGVYDPTAMDDFANACRTAGILDGMREIVVTKELLDKHAFPAESFAAVSLKAQVQQHAPSSRCSEV